jgi:hypothetical protein
VLDRDVQRMVPNAKEQTVIERMKARARKFEGVFELEVLEKPSSC